MSAPRAGHTATLLPSGKVLIAGGQNDQGALATAELYYPQTNWFALCGSMTGPRVGHTSDAADKRQGATVVGGGLQPTSSRLGDSPTQLRRWQQQNCMTRIPTRLPVQEVCKTLVTGIPRACFRTELFW